jgi:hypothetical protein
MEMDPTSEVHEDSSLLLFLCSKFVSELLAVQILSKLIIRLGFLFCRILTYNLEKEKSKLCRKNYWIH